MAKDLVLRAGKPASLARYVASQLQSLFPSAEPSAAVDQIEAVLPRALDRMRPILENVRAFDPGCFDHFNSLQHCSFLYLLANELWLRGSSKDAIVDRLFCLNRALNSIDLFYAVMLPEIFFISHGIGSVLGNVTYKNRIVVFQNVTVGRIGNSKPIIGENVVLYPGACVSGNCNIGNNSVISAGAIVHNRDVPDDVVVTGQGTGLVFKARTRDYSGLYLRSAD